MKQLLNKWRTFLNEREKDWEEKEIIKTLYGFVTEQLKKFIQDKKSTVEYSTSFGKKKIKVTGLEKVLEKYGIQIGDRKALYSFIPEDNSRTKGTHMRGNIEIFFKFRGDDLSSYKKELNKWYPEMDLDDFATKKQGVVAELLLQLRYKLRDTFVHETQHLLNYLKHPDMPSTQEYANSSEEMEAYFREALHKFHRKWERPMSAKVKIRGEEHSPKDVIRWQREGRYESKFTSEEKNKIIRKLMDSVSFPGTTFWYRLTDENKKRLKKRLYSYIKKFVERELNSS